MNLYYVVAEAGDFKIEDEIRANSLKQLARFVREMIACYRDWVRDGLVVDCSNIKFKYTQVLDNNDNDVTTMATAASLIRRRKQ